MYYGRLEASPTPGFLEPPCQSTDFGTHSKPSLMGEAFRIHSCVCIKGLVVLPKNGDDTLISV